MLKVNSAWSVPRDPSDMEIGKRMEPMEERTDLVLDYITVQVTDLNCNQLDI